MAGNRSHMTEEIWRLTLEIICLLTGEDPPPPVKSGGHVTITVPPPPSLMPERLIIQKILEVANKMTELLTAELSGAGNSGTSSSKIKQEDDDIAVYLSVEERGYLKGHPELYKADMIEEEPLPPSPGYRLLPHPPSPDGSRTTPETSPHRLYSHDSTQEGHMIPPQYQMGIPDEPHVLVKEEKEEELVLDQSHPAAIARDQYENTELTSSMLTAERSPLGGGGASAEETDVKEEISPVIAGRYVRSNAMTHPNLAPYYETEDDDSKADSITRDVSGHWGCVPETAHPVTHRAAQRGECFSQRKNRIVEKPYSCSKCGKGFLAKSSLTRHQVVHSGEKLYSCAECGKGFPDTSALIKHERIHTGERPYSCSECGRCFSAKASLDRHVTIHTGMKLYLCSECGKGFSQKSDLIRHKKLHTGEKPYPCAECGRRFSEKYDLFKHQSVHTGEKPYLCSECGTRFFKTWQLIRHQRIHTGERPYPCSECGRCFSTKSTLIKHQALHSGVKPYSCSSCGKCFATKSYLTKHEKLHVS